MDVKQHQRFVVADRSYVNLVKRDISKLAESYGFNETEIGRINIAVSELATNLIKHVAEGGELLVKPIGEDLAGMEIISIDRGRGLAEPERMLEDGFSTSGTQGEGLGAIMRQSSFFDYYTQVNGGSIFLLRFFKQVTPSPYLTRQIPRPEKLEIGAVMVAKNNETLCGDGWDLVQTDSTTYLATFDGLGHGPEAHAAASQAIDTFRKNYAQPPADCLRAIHAGIRRTRGAVGAICCFTKKTSELEFCGVGNINGKIFSASAPKTVSVIKNLISYNGILGHNIPNTLHNQRTELPVSRLLVLHSDGIKSRWDITKYPDLHRHDPSLIAAVIYRDFGRGTDDTLVVVAKVKS